MRDLLASAEISYQIFTLIEEPPGHRRDWSSLTRDKLLSRGYGLASDIYTRGRELDKPRLELRWANKKGQEWWRGCSQDRWRCEGASAYL